MASPQPRHPGAVAVSGRVGESDSTPSSSGSRGCSRRGSTCPCRRSVLARWCPSSDRLQV